MIRGHLAAVRRVLQAGPPSQDRYRVLNLGRGQGLSELQLLQAFEQHTGHPMPHQWAPRRAGDAACWMADVTADVTAARQHLGWQAELGPAEMLRCASMPGGGRAGLSNHWPALKRKKHAFSRCTQHQRAAWPKQLG